MVFGLRQSRWISLGETVQRTVFKMLDATAYPGGLISSTSGRHKLYYYAFPPDIFHGRHKDYQLSPTLSTFSTVFVKSDFHHWRSFGFRLKSAGSKRAQTISTAPATSLHTIEGACRKYESSALHYSAFDRTTISKTGAPLSSTLKQRLCGKIIQ
ncbi:hypothetical protein AOQ84DRAFT_106111 [Glonium stellatum]|uniref:Uncharacterized protein n=1 Tax=Glonium stellatum TaxID=574774 RepID=A0A8E2FAS3_9PEZI|nr:hypothetical protein AOQ84DRAFT_106111 [Glonium stellatum]